MMSVNIKHANVCDSKAGDSATLFSYGFCYLGLENIESSQQDG